MQQTEIYLALIFTTCIVLVFVVGIVLIILQYRKRKLIHQTEKQHMEWAHTNNLKEAALQMQQLTMQDIGREIHDGVGQRLTLASIYVQQLLQKNIDSNESKKISEVNNILSDSLVQLRSLSKELTNDNEHIVSLSDMVSQEVNKVQQLDTCTIVADVQASIFVAHKTAISLIRILQEFVQNSLKFANCKTIQIVLKAEHHKLFFNLTDDGKGFDINAHHKGIGLQNMKRRAQMIEAQSILESKISHGTNLTVEVNI
jgi:signal transduction histidine kinase